MLLLSTSYDEAWDCFSTLRGAGHRAIISDIEFPRDGQARPPTAGLELSSPGSDG